MQPSSIRLTARPVLAAGAMLLIMLAGFVTLPATAGPAEKDVLAAVVRLQAEVPPDARTAPGLGTEREGNGVVIDDNGLVLTIGYLILEAMSVTVFDAEGRPVQSDILAYDYDTGFGLIRARAPLGVRPLALGDSDKVAERDPVLVAGHGGAAGTIGAVVVSRREFAGYWEYLLDNAIFTAPPHPNWGGAALIDLDGKLVGIGSLVVNDALPEARPIPGNMFVPINLLKPIFADLLDRGRAGGPQRPWLGMFTAEHSGHVMVTRVAPDGPAAAAGLRAGDVVVDVGGQTVGSMADLFRKVWRSGPAGTEIPMRVQRDGHLTEFEVRSADRYDYLKLKPSY